MQPGDPEWADAVTLARRRIAALARICVRNYVEEWWHAAAVGPALDGVIRHARGYSDGIRRLMLELPQQEGKTLFKCLTAASLLGQAPEMRVQDIGYADDFIKLSSATMSEIGASAGFRDTYPDVALGRVHELRRGGARQDQKATDTAHMIDVQRRTLHGWKRSGGSFVARSIRGPVGGRPGDLMMLDDPYKTWDGDQGALSAAWNQTVRNFYGAVFRMRQQSTRSCELIAFTPFTDDDIREEILRAWTTSGWPFLRVKLPMIQRAGSGDYEHERDWLLGCTPALRGLADFLEVDLEALRVAIAAGGRCRPYDERPPGAALSPNRRGQDLADERRVSMIPRDYAALCDLSPISDLVNRFPPERFKLWDPNELAPSAMDGFKLVIDSNGDKTNDGAFASLGVWGMRHREDQGPGKHPRLYYRMAELRDRPGYSDFCDMVSKTLRTWPEVRTVRIERTAHGRSMATDETFLSREECRRATFEFVPVDNASKSSRWAKIEEPLRQGCIYVPAAVSPCGRVDPSWVFDRTDASAAAMQDGRAWGYVGEMKRAGRGVVCDRVDETELMISAFADDDGTDAAIALMRRLRQRQSAG